MKRVKYSPKFYRDLLDNLFDGVYFVDRERCIEYWNKGAERITGYKARQVIGTYCHNNILIHVNAKGTQLCLNGCPLHATITDGEPREAEVYLHHANGHRLPVTIRTSPIFNTQGEITGAVEIFSSDETMISIRQRVKELEDTALTDPLLEIGNRRYLEMKINSTLIELQYSELPFGILFIDLEHYKTINDSFGHEQGDRALHMIAQTLRLNIRAEDILGRWGGDEFIILLTGLDQTNLCAVADKLRALVEQSKLYINNLEIQITCSIGVTLARPGDSIETLVRRADNLMYRGKRKGGNCIVFG